MVFNTSRSFQYSLLTPLFVQPPSLGDQPTPKGFGLKVGTHSRLWEGSPHPLRDFYRCSPIPIGNSLPLLYFSLFSFFLQFKLVAVVKSKVQYIESS